MSLLGSDGLGVRISVFFNGHDVGVGSQDLNVSIGEVSGETTDNVPFVGDIGIGAKLAGNGKGARGKTSVVFESHDITSGNRVLGLLDRGEGGRSGKSWENEENECK